MMSPRQKEILELIRRGVTTKHIAHQLGVETSTIYSHIREMMIELNVNNRAQLLYTTDEGIEALHEEIARLKKRIIDTNYFAYHQHLTQIGIHSVDQTDKACIGTNTRTLEIAKALKRLDVIHMENSRHGPLVWLNREPS